MSLLDRSARAALEALCAVWRRQEPVACPPWCPCRTTADDPDETAADAAGAPVEQP